MFGRCEKGQSEEGGEKGQSEERGEKGQNEEGGRGRGEGAE